MPIIKEKPQYHPLPKEEVLAIKKGDVLERMLAFSIPVYIIVQEVTDDIIDAGWTFDRKTGLEVDEDIQRMSPGMQISYIRRVLTEEQKNYLKQEGITEVPYPWVEPLKTNNNESSTTNGENARDREAPKEGALPN